MKNMSKDIPTFESEDEEREFWATHDSTEYVDWDKASLNVDLASAQHTYFERACRTFEQQHQMSSEEFMQQFESGALGDEAIYFDWYAAKRGLDLWERRFRILSGVEVTA